MAPTPAGSPYRWVPPIAAVIAALALLASGLGVRFGLWDYGVGFGVLRWSTYLGLAAAALALILLVVARPRRRAVPMLVAGLVVGLGVAAVPLSWLLATRSLPPIHDVSTDTDNPPQFVDILPRRAKAENPAVYGGSAVAELQHRGFPDIKPLIVSLPPKAAFAKALEAARRMGWEIVAADEAQHRIEATATTSFFAFKDDVVIRIAPEGNGSRIDVRSVSRVGGSDLGTNARRVRAYLAELAK